MEDPPTLDQVSLVVGQMGPMVEFYRLLGVTIDEPPAPWDDHHRSAGSTGGTALDLDSSTFAAHWNRSWPPSGRGVVVGFRVERRETVDETYERLTAAGHTGQQPPWDAFWGARYAIVTDPEGNSVGIMSAIDPARESQPPDLA